MNTNFILSLAVAGLLMLLGISCTPSSRNGTESETDTASEMKSTSVNYAEEAAGVTPILTGTRIPDVSVRNIDGDSVNLRNLISRDPTVLIFYRGGWCPYCNKHMAELQQVEERLVDMGYQILAVSPDRPEKLKESISKHDLSYTLLSDSPMIASSAFGLAFKVDQKTLKRYDQIGIDLEESSGYDHHLLPVPAVFLVDTEGMIRFKYVNPDYKVRVKSKVLLAAAETYLPEGV